jgi:hypothetical protein
MAEASSTLTPMRLAMVVTIRQELGALKRRIAAVVPATQ